MEEGKGRMILPHVHSPQFSYPYVSKSKLMIPSDIKQPHAERIKMLGHMSAEDTEAVLEKQNA